MAPKSAQRYKDRADYYFLAGNYDKAAADFAEAFTLEPDNARFYRGVYKALQKGGGSAMADAAFKEVLAGNTAKAKGSIGAVYAEYLLTEKRFEESKAQWTEAFVSADFKPSGDDYNAAAIAHLRTADRAGAERLLDKAISLEPRKVDFILNRADVAIEAEEWEKVYSLAQQALAVASNHPKANMMMAVGVKRTGRGDALASEYEAKAKKLDAEQNALVQVTTVTCTHCFPHIPSMHRLISLLLLIALSPIAHAQDGGMKIKFHKDRPVQLLSYSPLYDANNTNVSKRKLKKSDRFTDAEVEEIFRRLGQSGLVPQGIVKANPTKLRSHTTKRMSSHPSHC